MPPLLTAAIPADVAVEIMTTMLDAVDLRHLVRAAAATEKKEDNLLLQVLQESGAAFRARRVLSHTDLAWFAKRRLRVDLLRTMSNYIKLGHDMAWRDGPKTEHQKNVFVTTTRWCRNGQPHRDNDLPAIERTNGDKEWWVDGKRHRDNDLPAVIWPYGGRCGLNRLEWWVHGRRHRDFDLPALTGLDQCGPYQAWYWRGQLHRGEDRPARTWSDGTQEWWQKGRPHRGGDQPAVVLPNGQTLWYEYGRRYFPGAAPQINK